MIDIKYCKSCLYPETKPDLKFNQDGIYSACVAYKDELRLIGKKRASF